MAGPTPEGGAVADVDLGGSAPRNTISSLFPACDSW